MNLLLCFPNTDDFEEVLQHIEVAKPSRGQAAIIFTPFLAHQIAVCFTGETVEETENVLTKVFSQKRYHLALFSGFASSWKAEIPVGTIVNVIREQTSGESHVNMTNSYMNIFFEFKKVLSASKAQVEKTDIETQTGAVFAKLCLEQRQQFYQLRAIDKNIAVNEVDKEKAKKVLNQTLIAILNVI